MIGHDEHDNEKADDDEDDADFHDAEKDNNYHLHSHSLSPPSGHIPAATLLSLILCTLFFRAAAFLIFSASGVPLASSLALLNCCIAATSWNFLLLSVRYFHIVLHWFAPFCLTRKCDSQDTADISVPKRNSKIALCHA